MENKIVVLGRGFLGKTFEKKGFEVWGKDKFYFYEHSFLMKNFDHHVFDNYDTIINCVGKSNTRWCEKDENWEEALFANGKIPKMLSKFCREKDKKFVHISTGCLYDRNDVPQREDDPLAKVSHCNYVTTKWVGEKGCNPEKDLILRPRLYFGDFEDKNNLLCKMKNFEEFLVEPNSYTSVHTIVDATEALLEAGQSGIFNVACDGYASVKDLAEWISLRGWRISEKELHEREGLYLVSNIMDISKLKKIYKSPQLKDEVLRCWKELEK